MPTDTIHHVTHSLPRTTPGSHPGRPPRRRRVVPRWQAYVALALALHIVAVPAALAQVIPPPPPNPLFPLPLPLSAHQVPRPSNLANFVKDEAAAIRLGKALFFDMQAGSDGIVACATCHFHAGADSRLKNQLNPGILHGASTFEVAGPNAVLQPGQFPFHRFANPDDPNSPVLFDADDVVSSAGVFKTQFVDVAPGHAEDVCVQQADPIWNVAGTKVRRVEPRNTPTVINSIFNFRNFWDGRASFLFNGVNPVGPRDPAARVLEVQPDTSVLPVQVAIDNGSLASQAVGPPGSPFEMSCDGRTFPKIGKKMLSLPPLAKQVVDPSDSVLGAIANSATSAGAPGIGTTYAQMIQAAFQDKWWSSDKVVTFPGGVPTVSPPVGGALTTSQYTLTEANFSLFWGLAIQLYEATLISGDTPFDRFAAGDGSALSVPQQEGLDLFMNQGSCILCHTGSLFSAATTNQIGVMGLRRPEPEFPIEQMHMQLGEDLSVLTFVQPAAGVPPLLPLTFDPRGLPIEVTQGTTCADPVAFTGSVPGTPGSCAPTGIAPLVALTPTGLVALPPPALATAVFNVGDVCAQDLVVSLVSVPAGPYRLCVDGIDRGEILVTSIGGASEGFIQFAAPPPAPLPAELPLTFDPRGTTLQLTQGASCADPVAFQGPFPGMPAPACDPLVPIDLSRAFDATVQLAATGIVPLGPFPFAQASLAIAPDCSGMFVVQLLGVPGGQYTLCADGVARGSLNVIAEARYDNGFYNIGVRPTGEDLGIGGDAMGPIAFVKRLQLGLPVPELLGIQTPPPILPGDRIAVNGNFKVPTLRNLSLTAPYMHSGGMGTIQHVVEFYARGADFFLDNIQDLDPEVAGIGAVRGNAGRKAALVSFLQQALTDDRVRFEKAPFDHPQLFVPNGHPGDATRVLDDGTGKARDVLMEVPPVGAAGVCIGLDGSRDTAPRTCGVAAAVVGADVSVRAGSPTTKFGGNTSLIVDASSAKQTFLRVSVTGIGPRQVLDARLRLQASSASAASSDSGGRIHQISSCNWSELAMTWNTRPPIDGAVISTVGVVAKSALVDFNLTPAITHDGVYCFAIDSLSTNDVLYNSREATTGRPQVLLTTGPCDCAAAQGPSCGDGAVNQPSEECDGPADAACPGACRADCTCLLPPAAATSTSTSTSTTTSTSTSTSAPAATIPTTTVTTSTVTTTTAPAGTGGTSAFQAGVSGPAGSANVDTYVRLATPTTNNGSAADIFVGVTNAADKINRGLMAFNLAGIPATATVTGCTLQVNVLQRTSPTAGHLRRLCGEHWLDGDGQGETQATWNLWQTGSNWGTAGAASTADCAAGGDYSTAGEVAYTPPVGTGAFAFPSLTALCQDALAARGGWLRLRVSQDTETTQSNLIRFDSSEGTTAANRPRLTVTWTNP